MILKTSSLNIQEIKNSILQQIGHPYLAKFVKNPVISEDKLMFLSSLVDNTDLTTEKKKQYIITTMLVQTALDTHELVSSSNDNEADQEKKSRQLTVLAGDYYSGLYYYLLSKIEDVPMIHTLAGAIKEINEEKMKLYHQDVHSFQQFFETLKHIESLLIQKVALFLNRPVINDIAQDWLLVKRLSEESDAYHKMGRTTPFYELLSKVPMSNNNGLHSTNLIDSFIETTALKLEQSLTKLPAHFDSLKSYVQDKLYQTIRINQKAVEEG